jgi:hypothetical protein
LLSNSTPSVFSLVYPTANLFYQWYNLIDHSCRMQLHI